MIRKIGVIYQDRNSLGFLQGLHDRLKCEAELIAPTTALGRSSLLTRQQVKRAWKEFQARGVDMVVRFTDADRSRWQQVKRAELSIIPDEARSRWLCGVAANNPEDWMALDRDYIAKKLGLTPEELTDPKHRADRIKKALTRARKDQQGQSDVVASLVREAPSPVFRRWLADEALRAFYSDCRGAATAENCETPNELDEAE